jgi:hypothetical protein
MVVIIMLEQRVVGVVGLEAAGSRIRMPSSTAPGAWLGHEPGDTKGQQRSQADSRDLAMTSANALEQQRSRRHAVHGMQEVSCPASPDHALSGAAAVVKMPIYAQNSSNSCWS